MRTGFQAPILGTVHDMNAECGGVFNITPNFKITFIFPAVIRK
jgi:hypothetical protein